MEAEANHHLSVAHRYFEDDLRQENIELKLRIRALEKTLRGIKATIDRNDRTNVAFGWNTKKRTPSIELQPSLHDIGH